MTTVIAGLDHSTVEQCYLFRELSVCVLTMESNDDQDSEVMIL